MKPLLLATALLAGLLACHPVEQFAGAVQLHRDLEAAYPKTDIDLSLVNGIHKLALTMNGPAFRDLSVGAKENKAKEVARFALEHYAHSDQVDTIKVAFVLKRTHILVYTKTESVGWSFATRDLGS
jgi:hypothetical protein